ncbi:hypothetical protein TNIN_177651 [Trichonephila inaurata madagascariensis]|uniref:Uncharacterized protein n=1 Tax=Trichonephila inaurata madagascariensis TaxID=2747483 RepID=A0A8X6X8D2_9ARAC|nr:hypothetical protein TNIN_177651 [Trichonephila inaurata madagascariensis]
MPSRNSFNSFGDPLLRILNEIKYNYKYSGCILTMLPSDTGDWKLIPIATYIFSFTYGKDRHNIARRSRNGLNGNNKTSLPFSFSRRICVGHIICIVLLGLQAYTVKKFRSVVDSGCQGIFQETINGIINIMLRHL